MKLADLRQDAAPMLLVLFLLAVQLGPAAHLVFHRNDHSHGGPLTARTHALAHRTGQPHAHAAEGDPREQTPAPAPPERAPDHGSWNSAHFGLALLDGPSAPTVYRPAERLPLPAVAEPRPHLPPADPGPPVRGPPFDTLAVHSSVVHS